jgi:glycosyltransferase involved in cell wall biosynthesis
MVSVVIPAYNAAPYIAATLESVFAQTFTDYEVIVVNDGSPDTPAFERALAPYRDRIEYITQPNAGAGSARNTGIQRARGTYIALLDSDDRWMPEYLAEQVRRLTADPTIDLLYSNGVLIGDTPLTGRTLMSLTPSQGPVTFESLIEERCTVLTSCTVVRREALMDVGLFDPRFRRCEDGHLWFRLAFSGRRLAYHRRPLVWHVRRAGSLSDDVPGMIASFIDAMRDLESTLPLTQAQRVVVDRHIADRRAHLALHEGRRLFLTGQYDRAADALARAAAFEPDRWKHARLRLMQVGMSTTPRLMRRLYDALREGSPTARIGSASSS